ncbi:Asparagine-rich protein [Plasmodium coatneyi]|uniref:Asparagine-rich protein n=1 Tax=Plasmodium coatneyi TaxID=208452 RepID=A0A1B1E790_9APIC|nr:Asparagine-rich protein [Plasmodium coatneyi]ANQ10810.1 Asparagine-rich protein [Plasmodium coatneyi]
MEEIPQEMNDRQDDKCSKKSTPVKSKDDAPAVNGKGGKGSNSSCKSAGATAAAGTSGGAGGYLFSLIDRFNSLKKVDQKVEEKKSGNLKEPNECNGTDQKGDVKKGTDEASRDGDAKKEGKADPAAKSERGRGKKGLKKEPKKGVKEGKDGSEEIGKTGETVQRVEKSSDKKNPQDEIEKGTSEPVSCKNGKKANSKGDVGNKEKPTNASDSAKEGDGYTSNNSGSNRGKGAPSDRGSGNSNEDPLMKSPCDGELAKVQELIKQIKKNEELYSDELNGDLLFLYEELYHTLLDRLESTKLKNKDMKKLIKREIEKFKENHSIVSDYLKGCEQEVKATLVSWGGDDEQAGKQSDKQSAEQSDKQSDKQSGEQSRQESEKSQEATAQQLDQGMVSQVKKSFHQYVEQKMSNDNYDHSALEENLLKNRNMSLLFLLFCKKHIIRFVEEVFSTMRLIVQKGEKCKNQMSSLLKRLNSMNTILHFLITTNERNGGVDNAVNTAGNSSGLMHGSYSDKAFQRDTKLCINGVNTKMGMALVENKDYVDVKRETEELGEKDDKHKHLHERLQSNHLHQELPNKTNFRSLSNGSNKTSKINKLSLNKKTFNYFRKDMNETQVSLSTCLTDTSVLDKKVRDKNVKKKVIGNENDSSDVVAQSDKEGAPSKKAPYENAGSGSANGSGNGSRSGKNTQGNSSSNDYFSDMMVYISWVPKSARCQYPLELPKNSAERNKLAEYIEAKEQMLYILKLMGYEEIDNIYFHPPKGSHIKIKFRTLACMNKFLRAYKNTPDKWKEDMFNFFNIPLRSSISVRDLRIERAVPRSSASEFKKIKKISKNYQDLFLFKDNYNLCEDGNSTTSKMEKVNLHYDAFNKHIMVHNNSGGTTAATSAAASVAGVPTAAGAIGMVVTDPQQHYNESTHFSLKKNADQGKSFSKMKGIMGPMGGEFNSGVMHGVGGNPSHVDDLHNGNMSLGVNATSTASYGGLSSFGGYGGGISTGTTSIMGGIGTSSSYLNGAGNGMMNSGVHAPYPFSGHHNTSSSTTTATALMMPNGMLNRVSGASGNVQHGVYMGGKNGGNNVRDDGRTFLGGTHMGSGFSSGNGGMGSSVSGHYGSPMGSHLANHSGNHIGNHLGTPLNSDTFNHYSSGWMHSGGLSNKGGSGKPSYPINHNNTMCTSTSASKILYPTKSGRNVNNKGSCVGMGGTSGGEVVGGSFLSSSKFLGNSNSNSHNGMHAMNKDFLTNGSYTLKKQTHYASFSNNSNGNMNSLNDHFYAFNGSGGSTANVNGLNDLNGAHGVNGGTIGSNGIGSHNYGSSSIMVNTVHNTQHSNNNSNNNSTRGTQNGTTNLNPFSTSSAHLDTATFTKEKNYLRGFKNSYMGMGSFGGGSAYSENNLNNSCSNSCSNSIMNNSNGLMGFSHGRVGGEESLKSNNVSGNDSSSANCHSNKYESDLASQKYGNQNDDMKEDFKNLINIDFINDIDMEFDEKNNDQISVNNGSDHNSGNVYEEFHQLNNRHTNNEKRLNELSSCMSEEFLSGGAKARDFEKFDKFASFEKFDSFDKFESYNKYDKYDKYDNYDKYDSYDKYDKFDTYDKLPFKNVNHEPSYRMNGEEDEQAEAADAEDAEVKNFNDEINLREKEFANSNSSLSKNNQVGNAFGVDVDDDTGMILSEGFNNYFCEENPKSLYNYYGSSSGGGMLTHTTSTATTGNKSSLHLNLSTSGNSGHNSSSAILGEATLSNNCSGGMETSENGIGTSAANGLANSSGNSTTNSVGNNGMINTTSSLYRNTMTPKLYMDANPMNSTFGKYDEGNFCEVNKEDKLRETGDGAASAVADYDLKMSEEDANKGFLNYPFQSSRVDNEQSFSDNYVNFF